MKVNKIFVAFVVLLICVLGYGFFSSKKGEETKKVDNKEVKVGVLQLLSHPALDQIYKGLEDGLKKEGYEVGKNLKIDLQNAQGDQSNLASMGQKLVTDNNDILVGITTPATLSLSNATKDKPIIMGGITYPVEAGLIKAEDKPGNNITGVSDRTPIKQQLELMKEMFDFISKFEGDIPGASALECGNFYNNNLPMAKYEAKKYLETLHHLTDKNLNYPK